MYNQNPKTMKDFLSYTSDVAALLYYKNPKDEWECCRVVWYDGELAYYSPLLPNAYPIPPIPFRLANSSNFYWKNYMLDTGVRHPDKIKDLIKKYDLATVKYDKYQVIPSTEYNIQRLECLLTVQFLLFNAAVEKEITATKLALSERLQESIDQVAKLKKEFSDQGKSHDMYLSFLVKDYLDCWRGHNK